MTDRYTKAVLTLIAVALVVIAIENAIRPTTAQFGSGIQKVQICDTQDCATVMPVTGRIGGLRSFALQVTPAN